MKKIINNIYLMCSIVLLVVLGACSDEDKFMGGNDEIVVTAIMPDDGTTPSHGTLKGVAVSSDDNTLNLITKWKSGDKIQVFVRQDNKVYKVSEESAVYNISSDGKTCSFNFSLPSSIDGARVYDVIGVTGISAQASGSEVYATSTLKRMNLDSNGEATSPMWFITAKTNTATNFQAKFQHLGTYEILHVTNATSGDLTFRHLGFDVSEPWFKYNDNTALNNTYDPTASFTEPGDVESPPILIKSGKTGKILSWYMPSGSLMQGAKLLALINGKNVTSSNTKSSALPIQRGKAYHMYATWDGKQLKFDDNEHGAANSCPDNNHPHLIDLGLPSGTMWACCNVGAITPDGFGGYYAWGETEEKDIYTWSTYTHCDGSWYNCHYLGYCISGTQYDVAHVKWGGAWQMPTAEQFEELINECTRERAIENGVEGIKMIAPNGNSLFLPGAGIRDDLDADNNGGKSCTYKTSTPYNDYSDYNISVAINGHGWGSYRYEGMPVRPVCNTIDIIIGILSCPDNNHPHQINLGLPSGTMWACCNVGATTPNDYGEYYAWGETETKDYYDYSTYNNPQLNDISGTLYDVAHVKWGGSWKMPNKFMIQELMDFCTHKETELNGVVGMAFTGPNGYAIFLPFAGEYYNNHMSYDGGYRGYYQCSYKSYSTASDYLGIDGSGICYGSSSPVSGYSVRAIVGAD